MYIGLVGLGFIGATHLQAYSRISEIEIGAVCTRDTRALSGNLNHIHGNFSLGALRDFSQAKKYTNWHDLVRDSSLGAVDVCAPTDLHASITIAALEAGKHVFCEKPMALSAEDCGRMISAANNSGRVLMIGQVLRFWPEYEYLLEFVKSRQYGSILSITFTRHCGLPDWSGWLTAEERSGGAILDLLIHDIDQAILMFGMPDRVAAKQLGGVDTLAATLIYPNGPEVRIQGGWFQTGAPLRMGFQIRAERGELNFASGELWLNDESGKTKPLKLPESNAFEKELAYFVDCCENGRSPERCPPEDSQKAVKLALLLKESRAKEGEQIKCSA